MFQHSATRRWLPDAQGNYKPGNFVSTLSHPKVAASTSSGSASKSSVSTLSHPKVAALIVGDMAGKVMFQHSATRRWLPDAQGNYKPGNFVSTLSHPKVAASDGDFLCLRFFVSTLSHPKVAARTSASFAQRDPVSTLSHPKVAANPPKPPCGY